MFTVDFSDNLTSISLTFLGGLKNLFWITLVDLTEAISKSKDKLIYHQQMCFFISEEGKKDAISNSIVKKSILIKSFRCHQLSTQQNTQSAKIQIFLDYLGNLDCFLSIGNLTNAILKSLVFSPTV